MNDKELVIFDLDGTLLNTIADLATATNYALVQCGYPEHPVDAYRNFVGNGIRKLFERALPEEARTVEHIEELRTYYLSYYTEHNTDHTTYYEGIPELLDSLNRRGIALAVASNKYQEGAEKVVRHYFPHIPFVVVFGQRDGVPAKPDPTVVFEILDRTGIAVSRTLYVGDSGVDMQTARNAGVESVGVLWGFRSEEELQENGAKHIACVPDDILRWL